MSKQMTRWMMALVVVAGLAMTAVAQTNVAPAVEPSFAVKPVVVKEKGGVRIDFTLAVPSDVEVGIVGADGKIINHLAAGVLGGKYVPPEPLKEGLVQSLVWDGKDDAGNAVDVDTCKVRVRLGVKPAFAWTTYKYPRKPKPLREGLGAWIKFGRGANINGPGCNPDHIVTQVPPAYTGQLVCAYVDPGAGAGDQGMMVVLKQESDVFFAERDANTAAQKAYIEKFGYTNTGDKLILNCGSRGGTNASYSVYKAHGKAGDRFYRPQGCGSDNGILYGFWFANPDHLYTAGDDPWLVDPQTDFLTRSHKVLSAGSTAQIITDEDKGLDVYYWATSSWGEGYFQTFVCKDAASGTNLWTRGLRYDQMAFRKFPNADCGFGGNTALFDSRRGFIYNFSEPASSLPTGEKTQGAVLRFDYAAGKQAVWPETKVWYVGDLNKGDKAGWAGGGKGMALGPDGTLYINTQLNNMNKGGPLVVKTVKDGVIVNDRLIKVDVPFGNIKVDRQGNIYVGVYVSPKDGSWPEDIDPASIKEAGKYSNLSAIRVRTGSIMKFPATGGSVVDVPGNSTDFDFTVPSGGKLKAEKAPVWSYYGFMNIGQQTSCWCPWGSFDMDGWGRLFVPRTYEAGLVVIDSSRNLVCKLRNRDVTDEKSVPGFGMIPSNLGVTDNYMIVGDSIGGVHGFRLEARMTSLIDVKTGK